MSCVIYILLSSPQCVMIKETANDDIPLYAKIGCQHRDTYTSTKLQLIVYTDAQCSKGYGGEIKNDGYDLNGYWLSNKVKCFLREICMLLYTGTRRLEWRLLVDFKMMHSISLMSRPPLLPFQSQPSNLNHSIGILPSAVLQLSKLQTRRNIQHLLQAVFRLVRR